MLDAYGWPDLIGQTADEQTILERPVALNTQRRAEEAQGHVRRLRPEFQNPQAPQATLVGATLVAIGGIAGKPAPTEPGGIGAAVARLPWPQTLPDLLAAVARILTDSPTAQTEAQLAANFSGKGRWMGSSVASRQGLH